jgi:hypothetical protein
VLWSRVSSWGQDVSVVWARKRAAGVLAVDDEAMSEESTNLAGTILHSERMGSYSLYETLTTISLARRTLL